VYEPHNRPTSQTIQMRTIYLSLLALWLTGGSYFLKLFFCPSEEKPAATEISGTPATSPKSCDRSLTFSDENFNLTTPDNFVFARSGYRLKREPSTNLQAALSKLADYLNENSDRTILIEGIYTAKEKNSSKSDNLGLGRATSIKGYMINEFGINDKQILTGAQLKDKVCYSSQYKLYTRGAIATLGVK